MNNVANSTEEFSTVRRADLGSLRSKRCPGFGIRLLTGGTGQTGTDNTGTIRVLDKFICFALFGTLQSVTGLTCRQEVTPG